MKKSFLFSLIVVASLILITKAGIADDIDLVSDGGSTASSDAIGHVTISDDGNILKIIATLANGHEDVIDKDTEPPTELRNLHITGAQIHVSTQDPSVDPYWDDESKATKDGNPRPGHFEYSNKHNSSPQILLFGSPLVGYKTAILTIDSPDDDAYIAIHLEISGDLYYLDENNVWIEDGTGTDGAWAGVPDAWPGVTNWGMDFPGSNWATYIEHADVAVSPAPGRSSTMATRWGAMKTK